MARQLGLVCVPSCYGATKKDESQDTVTPYFEVPSDSSTEELEQISKGDVTGMRPSSREAGAHVWRADVVTRMYEIS